jgi:hypothetical protein
VVSISKESRQSSITICQANSPNIPIVSVVPHEQEERDGKCSFPSVKIKRKKGRKLTGRSITLVGEADRKMLKAAIKQSSADQIRHRIIPNEAIIAMSENLAGLTDEIQEILHEEKEEKLVRFRTIASVYANK